MNHLKIVVNFQTMPERSFGECPIVLPPRRMEVKIEFTLSTSWNNLPPLRVRRVTVIMEARENDDDDEDRLRDELIQNARAEHELWDTGNMVHDKNDPEWIIEIIDPSGVMKWFGIDRAKDIFKQQTEKHDQPVRLPAPASR